MHGQNHIKYKSSVRCRNWIYDVFRLSTVFITLSVGLSFHALDIHFFNSVVIPVSLVK